MSRTLIAALLGASLLLPGATARLISPDPPLCRVTATYWPAPWPTYYPPSERWRTIYITLRPGCPEDGMARVFLINRASGRRLPERGTYTLTPERPSLSIPGLPGGLIMPTWEVRWQAQNPAVTYLVPQLPPGGTP